MLLFCCEFETIVDELKKIESYCSSFNQFEIEELEYLKDSDGASRFCKRLINTINITQEDKFRNYNKFTACDFRVSRTVEIEGSMAGKVLHYFAISWQDSVPLGS